MAVQTICTSIYELWLADAIAGGTITERTASRMTYTSDLGFTVTVRGRDFVYDDSDLPAAGLVTRIDVAQGGVTHTSFAGLRLDFAQVGMFAFGWERDGFTQAPSGNWLWQLAMNGNDTVNGSALSDDLRGAGGNDLILAGDGDDYVGDQAGADTMNGGDGRDTLAFSEANWAYDATRGIVLDVAAGTVIDSWGALNRFSNFELYRDTLFSDTLRGSDQNELFGVNRGNDVIDGRGGLDTLDYSEASNWGAKRGVTVNLATGEATDSWRGKDSFTGIEQVFGTRFADRMTGSDRNERFLDDGGVDSIDAGAGFDWLNFWNAEQGVVVNTSLARNVQNDGFGNAEKALSIEGYGGGSYGDLFIGGALADNFYSGPGSDTLSGGAGNDVLGGGEDSDWLTGGAGSDAFLFYTGLSDAGVDTITDFVPGKDRIEIEGGWGVGVNNGLLTAAEFAAGAGLEAASTAAQRVIYNSATGGLWFDADGSGTNFAPVLFAVLVDPKAISEGDIWLYG
jgi:serralysin